ncbi:trypsin domain-containing protein [Phthorimaea operculella]|nr:trypsin domain-containing protein [Phthorimaea operculella]
MNTALIVLMGVAAVAALPANDPSRIVGGSVTNIQQYPFAVAMLLSRGGSAHSQSCGGAIINNRSVLTAAHCFMFDPQNNQWRSRVGSTNANSGGIVFNTNQIINHPQFNRNNLDMDFAIVRVQGTFNFNNNVRAGNIAGPNYAVPDNAPVWAIGWGHTCYRFCSGSEQLRHVEIWTTNLNTCRNRYSEIRLSVTNNMLCAGWLDVGGRDACQGDSGGPLLHNNVIVGVTSWGEQCAHERYPGVNARVSVASNWIVANS